MALQLLPHSHQAADSVSLRRKATRVEYVAYLNEDFPAQMYESEADHRRRPVLHSRAWQTSGDV